MAAPKEIWKNINIGYSVSSLGKVRSNDTQYIDIRNRERRKNGRILKYGYRKDGYLVVNVSGYKHKKNWKVHQLVASHFIPNPENKPCINHIDGDKQNNIVNNLEWCTYSENNKHAFRIGLRSPVINKEGKNGFSKKVIDTETLKIYDSITQVIRLSIVNHSYSALRAMLNGQNNNKTSLRYL